VTRQVNAEGFVGGIYATNGVVSGSSQVTLQSTTGFSAYDTALSVVTGSLISSASNHEQRLSANEAVSGTFARTNSTNTFNGNQVISGSLRITQDLIVLGSSSIQNVSSSTLNIGTNLITVATNQPSVRFGGLSVIDSGSSGASGSFLYDSVEDEFIFLHRGDGTNITSSHFVLGPETYNNLGNETYLTNNRVPKGTGKEHLNDSNITDTGTLITLGSNSVVNGTFYATGTTLVSGSSQIVGSSITTNTVTVGSTAIALGGTATTIAGLSSVTSTGFTGALTGNASTATTLATARTINGTVFDGTANISVPVAAADITGTRLAANVVESDLTGVGTLTSLDEGALGITLGGPSTSMAPFRTFLDPSTIPTLYSRNSGINFTVLDNTQPASQSAIKLINSATALAAGGLNAPAFIPDIAGNTNLGISTIKWNKVYANYFFGIASAAQYADLAEKYVADADYEPGTVLEFGGEFEVTLAEDGTSRLAGIVSTDPAYLMNSECQGNYTVALALQGRAPCKVRGKIEKGDMLISGGDGYARKTTNPQIGTIIGKALADFDGTSGVIEVAVGRV
jgi:hypothetical protein